MIVCLHSSHAPQLLSRNLLYTAVTRAQKLCVLAGDDKAIGRALANTDATDRHSLLASGCSAERYQRVARGSKSRRRRSRVTRTAPSARAVA